MAGKNVCPTNPHRGQRSRFFHLPADRVFEVGSDAILTFVSAFRSLPLSRRTATGLRGRMGCGGHRRPCRKRRPHEPRADALPREGSLASRGTARRRTLPAHRRPLCTGAPYGIVSFCLLVAVSLCEI